jgi:two-component system chemotaxis sensor kinase CheA
MDELIGDFLAETFEHLEGIEIQLLQFERTPNDASLVSGIFRLVHTVKGTASFLGLDRLHHVAHAAENLLGELRDGVPPTPQSVSVILATIDRIKAILRDIESLGAEPEGDDSELIAQLEAGGGANACDSGEAADVPDGASDAGVSKAEAIAPLGADTGKMPDANKIADRLQGIDRPKGVQAATKNTETIRVTVDTIERIMQLVSELVLNRNQLIEITRNRENDEVKPPLQRLSGLTTDLQDAVMRARMQPVGRLFTNLPRLMRELSSDLKKKINLVTEGADTELDRQLIEVLRDPLTHIIRNCADHGIETPEERLAAGKPETGEVIVAASHEAGQITIDIADDGRGLDLERIKEKVVAKGVVTLEQLETLSTEEIYRFIFAPGVSTASKVTSVSGRGVGMDVVRSNIESIGGSVSLSTVPGKGSRFSLRIPLTLAIAPALIVRVGSQRFAVPQTAVVEAVGLGPDSRHVIEKVHDGMVLQLREEVIPIVDLSSVLALELTDDKEKKDQLAIIIRVGSESFGVRVDEVVDIQEIVVKPLNASLSHLTVFTGQTILGDGSVVLILDPGGISRELGVEKSGEQKSKVVKDTHPRAHRTRLLLFRTGDGLPKVLPLSLLSRIEMVDAARIERSDGRYLMLHQGKLMPLLPTSQTRELSNKQHPVLVITADNHMIGLLVDEIVDIVEDDLAVQLPSLTNDLVGAAEIKGEAVEMIDVTYYLQAAYSSFYQQQSWHLLLVGDDLIFRDTLRPILASAGYLVTVTGSAAEARELIEQHKDFDAVLIDTELLDGQAYNFAHELRSKLKPDSPIFALYEMTPHDVLNVPLNDPNRFNLSKLDRRELLGTLSSVLTKRNMQQRSKELAA